MLTKAWLKSSFDLDYVKSILLAMKNPQKQAELCQQTLADIDCKYDACDFERFEGYVKWFRAQLVVWTNLAALPAAPAPEQPAPAEPEQAAPAAPGLRYLSDIVRITVGSSGLTVLLKGGEKITGTMSTLPGCREKPRKGEVHRWRIIYDALCGHKTSSDARYKVNETFRELLNTKDNIIDRSGNITVQIALKGADSYKKSSKRDYDERQAEYNGSAREFFSHHPDSTLENDEEY